MTSNLEQLELSGKAKVHKYLEQNGKLRTLNRLMGFRALDSHRKRTDANIAAEDAAVRRAMFGDNGPAASEEEMGHTILGDVTNPTPIVIHSGQQPQGSGIGKVLAGAALAAGLIGIPGAGVAGYFLSKLTDKPAATQLTTDDTVDIGLKRFSELAGGSK